MSIELISILVLAVIFVIATTLPINMGALAFAAAFLSASSTLFICRRLFAGSPKLFVVLVGVTFLVAIAQATDRRLLVPRSPRR